MNSKRVFSAVLFAALLCGCSSNDMTPAQAKSVLNDFFAKNPQTNKVLTGMNNIGTDPVAAHWDTPDGKYQKAMEAAGLVTITPPKGKIFNPQNHSQWMYALDVKLTDKGKKLVTGKPQVIPAPSKNTWDTVYENATFCTKEVVNIASISTNDDYARAEYTYKFGNFTPFYDSFHVADPKDTTTCPTQPQEATAGFDRKNGVWSLSPQ
jgi:hypothetical protein